MFATNLRTPYLISIQATKLLEHLIGDEVYLTTITCKQPMKQIRQLILLTMISGTIASVSGVLVYSHIGHKGWALTLLMLSTLCFNT